MEWTYPSRKQLAAMSWWTTRNDEYEGIIADGSIRSGKTLALSVGFVAWAMTKYENQNFAICGKTVTSCKKNVIDPLMQAIRGIYKSRYKHTDNCLYIGTNRFYIYGGKDEGSQTLIQGITLAGIMLDEVALMPESFVNQATARCSIDGSKMWMNCNPETPGHWFYEKWIKKARKNRMLLLHFTMDDNPSLTEGIKRRYISRYSGVFYDRFIRGLWVAAEGLVYDMFNAGSHVVPTIPRNARGEAQVRHYSEYYVAIDYGTMNATTFGLWGLSQGIWYKCGEYYYSGRDEKKQKTDLQFADDYKAFVKDLPVRGVIVDPSAASFITELKNRYIPVIKADNAVIDGIRLYSSLLQSNKVKICDCCKETIKEFGLYSWDKKAIGEDRPIKENDHCLDSDRYFVMHRLSGRGRLQFA